MFQILRTKKLTTFGNIAASGEHTFRERNTPNADPALTHLNHGNGARCTSDLLSAIKDKLKNVEVKQDSVLCIEHLITASPQFFAEKTEAEREKYFADSLRFFEEKYGKKNIVCSDVQLDEKTPHMVFYAVPIIEAPGIGMRKRSVKATAAEREETGKSTKIIEVPNKPSVRLSAKHYLGGWEKLSDLQTEFHEKVSSDFGLERGIKGSKASHKNLQKWYAELEPNIKNAMAVIDQAENVKKQQAAREEASIFKVESWSRRKRDEAETYIKKAENWHENAVNQLNNYVEKLNEKSKKNENFRQFLNSVGEEMKIVFSNMHDSDMLELPEDLHEKLINFCGMTPIKSPESNEFETDEKDGKSKINIKFRP